VAVVIPEQRRRPGRPRSEVARRAVLSATLELAAEHGPKGLRMEAIARKAGVSKETLYRWWRSKAEVVLEALAERGDETIPVPDTGTLAKDLRIFLRATVASGDATTRRLLRALAAEAASDPGMAELIRERFLDRRRVALGTILGRGVSRGEISRANAALALDLVYGSLWYRVIFGIAPLDNAWADRVAGSIAAIGTS
jgi:AcrR family transcriptional regulator